MSYYALRAESTETSMDENKPKQHLAHFARSGIAMLICIYLLLSFFPALYVFEARLPAPEQLHLSEGKLVFQWMGDDGYLTGLKKDGKEQFFTCAGWIASNNDCMEQPNPPHPLAGKSAKIWWFEQPVYFFKSYRRIARMEVDGASVVPYEKTRRRMLWAKNYAPLWTGGFFFICLMISAYLEFLARSINLHQASAELKPVRRQV